MPTSHQAFDAHLETWKREMAMPYKLLARFFQVIAQKA
jgi:hypothetical protein